MTDVKMFKGAPFGVQKSRFDVASMHPNLLKTGVTQVAFNHRLLSTKPEVGPGSYNLLQYGEFSDRTMSRRTAGPGWKESARAEWETRFPHRNVRPIVEARSEQKRKLGPGTYDYRGFLTDTKPTSLRGMCEPLEERFRPENREDVPGPGTYGLRGNPYTTAYTKKSFGRNGLLDKETDRSLPVQGSVLGPGRYEIKSSVDELNEKMVGTRGPYDLFSGERKAELKTGHYARISGMNLGPGQYTIESGVDEMNTSALKHRGRFSKQRRFDNPAYRRFISDLAQCPRDFEEPGPPHYHVNTASAPVRQVSRPPFGAGAARTDKQTVRFFTGNFNPVGPGRYDPQKIQERQYVNPHRSAFESKTDRALRRNQELHLRERLAVSGMTEGVRTFARHRSAGDMSVEMFKAKHKPSLIIA